MKKPQNSTKSRQMGEVRIISGLWRGRKLPVLNAEGLRPTTDRVKETVFNWLMNDVANARCLDCFAGSGSLGLEALSRQAQAVTFLEKFAKASQQLKNNLALLKTDKGKVINTDTLQFLAQKNNELPYDLIFIDPPFNKGFVPQVLDLLIKNNYIAPNGLIYVETEKNHTALVLPETWQILKEKTFGQVTSRLIQVCD
ncbi:MULTISPECIES: 16S rRNA (guanine(966)-N(2))-methyltransferase RsmD [Pasteurellaceae]|uniref:Ribosomal RNA small subunit methyltransferase D n=1 Tax=Pasteurella atlantica TaxID=2827233 RepID=A0AAW8CRB0_9PAST|nr:16S rRNA (guanine(966)-N(2))-methyltransferase RsmD [Pasteurella atlantica]MBR0574047.1 16S rRNA (guanine(966)-N(2))-methyltransferase RsmD [Pasteurella atlantica]MDP8040009.1 16S rRNA (guanine(966)-N(2))-methyltransferase RsmD [Pasteurella atlantica]MDP8042123.1 16S rRNA (guanine(966)-N(2))-methyltransferase RsmD [Pasteurella atlantica]MDP8044241.1 16S rRNA (guanine(966)-N(2))-methyltransferase RsmD [Pasteurella atlantica]MDP8046322.1 16S rRNA (guanine(966)-N(2))-methyltransferase RsmD [Pa